MSKRGLGSGKDTRDRHRLQQEERKARMQAQLATRQSEAEALRAARSQRRMERAAAFVSRANELHRKAAALMSDRAHEISSQVTSKLEAAAQRRLDFIAQRSRVQPSQKHEADPAQRNQPFEQQVEKHTMKIQKWWRMSRVKTAAAAVRQTSLFSIEATLSKATFDEVGSVLSDRSVLKSISDLINALAFYVHKKGKAKAAALQERVFLSSFMMALFPDTVFHAANVELEVRLQHQAVSLVNALYDLLQRPNARSVSTLVEVWGDFLEGFSVWKGDDRKHIIKTMMREFKELERLKSTVNRRLDSETASIWLQDIEKQQADIRTRLTKFNAIGALAVLDQATAEKVQKPKTARVKTVSRAQQTQVETSDQALAFSPTAVDIAANAQVRWSQSI
jgi:hypothetical protein